MTFMIVTVGHVAGYTGSFEQSGSEWLGWPYAIAVDASIAMCAYLTRWATTRRWAWIGYFAFVTASGALNVAYIDPQVWGEWIYALFPTGAIALLGFLARDVELLAERSSRSSGTKRRKSQDVQEIVQDKPGTSGTRDGQSAKVQDEELIVQDDDVNVLDDDTDVLDNDANVPDIDVNVLDLLEKYGTSVIGVREVQDELGLSRTMTYQVLNDLVSSGTIKRMSRGKYRIVQDYVDRLVQAGVLISAAEGE